MYYIFVKKKYSEMIKIKNKKRNIGVKKFCAIKNDIIDEKTPTTLH